MNKIEYKKCLMDSSRVYIIERYLLPILKGVRSNFYGRDFAKLTDSQIKILNTFNGEKSIYVSKGRNVGFTSLLALKISADIILSDGNEAFMFYGHNEKSFNHFKDIVKAILDESPNHIWTYKYDENAKVSKMKNMENGIETPNGCILVNIGKNYSKNVSNKRYDYCGANKKIRYSVMDEWIFGKDSISVMDYLNSSKIPILMGTTPKCIESNICYNIAKKYKDNGHLIEMKWESCFWMEDNAERLKDEYPSELEYLESNGKIFKIEEL